MNLIYPDVPKQRCWAHKLRNVAARLPRKLQVLPVEFTNKSCASAIANYGNRLDLAGWAEYFAPYPGLD